jgi:hypothetical protein
MEACAEVLMTPEDLSARRPASTVVVAGTDLVGIGSGAKGSSGKAASHRIQVRRRWNAPEMSGH